MNKRWLAWLIYGGVAVVIFVAVLRTVSLTAVLHSLAQLQLAQIIILILLNSAVILLITARWWLILWGMGHRLPFLLLVGHRLAAYGVTYFTPGPQFGGEPVQVLLPEKVHNVPRVTAVSAVALDKTLELIINFTFIVMGIMLLWQWGAFAEGVSSNAILFFLALLAFPALYLGAIWWDKRPLSYFARILKPIFNLRSGWGTAYERFVAAMNRSEAEAYMFCKQAPRFLGVAIIVSILAQGFLLVEFATMLNALGADLSLLEAIILLTAVRVAYLLPLPGGVGSVDAAMAVTLNLLGSNPAIAISAGLFIRSRDVLLGLIGLWWGAGGWRFWGGEQRLEIGD